MPSRSRGIVFAFAQECRQAVRGLLRAPFYATVAIISLAAGMAAIGSAASIIDEIDIAGLPYQDASHLVTPLASLSRSSTCPGCDASFSAASFSLVRDATRSYDDLERWGSLPLELVSPDRIAEIPAAIASPGLLPLLGATSYIGRLLLPSDSLATSAPAAVLSYSAWQERFGAENGVVGRTISLRMKGRAQTRTSVTIVGILSPGFHWRGNPDVWISTGNPLVATPVALETIGHLRVGVTAVAAEHEARGLLPRLQMVDTAVAGIRVESLRDYLLGDTGVGNGRFIILGIAAGLLLLVAINLGGLTFVRMLQRRAEFAVRRALGASPLRLAALIGAETTLLSLVAAAIGVALAVPLTELLGSKMNLPAFGLSASVRPLPILGVVGIALLVGTILGGAAALRVLRELRPGLTSAGSKSTSRGLGAAHAALIASQLALAMIFMSGTGVLAKSVSNLERSRMGYDPHDLFGVQPLPPSLAYRPGVSREMAPRAMRQFRAAAGVTDIAALAFDRDANLQTAASPPLPLSVPRVVYGVTPNYFRTMRIQLIRGRSFDATDDATGPAVAVVSATAANKLWPGRDAIGQRIAFSDVSPGAAVTSATVVGIVADANWEADPTHDPRIVLYRPFAQSSAQGLTVFLRFSRVAAGTMPSLESITRSLRGEAVPSDAIRSMEDTAAGFLAKPRFDRAAMGLAAGVGVLLAIMGIFGTVAYAVSATRREAGIRLALGASRPNVVLTTMRPAVAASGIGVVLGVMGAFATGRLLRSIAYGVSHADPTSVAISALVMVAVALAAAYAPARRAARVDPSEALRSEH